MFGVLDSLNDKDATDIVYYVIKMITKSRNDTEIDDVLIDLSDEHLAIAEEILNQLIERFTEKDGEKREKGLEESISKLYLYLEDRMVSSEPEDVKRGKALLEELKQSEN